LAIVGGLLLVRGVADAPHPPPQPPASAARPLPTAAPTPAAVPAAAPAKPPPPPLSLPYSTPVEVKIGAVGIDADIMKVGQEDDGTVDVPSEYQAREAGWFKLSPSPGQLGPSVILGHVDSYQVPDKKAAFYYLGSVRPGNTVEVDRADGMAAVFTVDSVEVAKKNDFPTAKVYSPTPYAALRLITCGGSWTKHTSYDSNVIVYAHLTSAHRR
jgi:Sortase domain